VRNVLALQLAARCKQLPRSGAVAALTIYIRYDLLLPLNMTATEKNVLLGFIKVRQLLLAVHALHHAEVGLTIVEAASIGQARSFLMMMCPPRRIF
jgi:hypothetical protein